MNITIGLMAILTLASLSQPASAQVYSGPLQPHVGGQVTTAFSNSFGPDAELTLTFKQVNASVLGVDYSSTRGLVVHRNIRVIDRQDETTYVLGYAQTMPVVIPNTTSLGISAASLIELRTTGQTALSLIYNSDLAKIDGVLTLVAKDIKAPLLIEDQLIQVPVVQATGTFAGGRGNRRGTGDFYFIDDKNNAMMLEDTIQFSWEDQPRAERITRVTAGKSMELAMEKTPDIAVTLKHNPTWRLQINGHTNSIGDAAYNLKLSADRAAAVKDAIVKQGIAASRLQTAGLGQTKPKSGNDTLEGRSLNRRVELVRTDR